ncbi:uncharacterized protein LOC124365224 isoform X2 [Homalodisca vitripennis]|uniref:uncharacterized protein LOC124365224 isoform X2 n=1 Tax=Homalodisca vitripennis TaxID=197043 RepID=UPI001EE9DA07|nr:uncharacterized protein LOC124365224 isoform X2 [Homalodisca vitripennis]
MYFYVVVWLCLLGTEVSASPRCVEILDAGLLPVVKDHIGIHFFVTVINRGPEATEVEVTMVQCCEEFPGSSTECSHIHLIPETRILDVGKTRNFTLIYPTLYPYNRRGECLLSVHYMTSCNRSKEARQHIAFDTTLSDDNVKCHVLRGFPGYVMEQPLCKSYDEDALDSCKMVDCHKKYFGLRSYFNRGTRVCEPVPACLPSKRRGMPDTVYDVTVNRCADMTGCLSTCLMLTWSPSVFPHIPAEWPSSIAITAASATTPGTASVRAVMLEPQCRKNRATHVLRCSILVMWTTAVGAGTDS